EEAKIILAIGAVVAVLGIIAIMKKERPSVIVGILGVLTVMGMGYLYLGLSGHVDSLSNQIGDAFNAFSPGAKLSVRISYGFWVTGIGALLTLYAGFVSKEQEKLEESETENKR
ncbi:MAG: hypothetical protein RBS43_11605, partial [Candidatus Cloacimonas sp.]|nr:hypothetical protein [Candidatus Cloacimonas sp.]